MNRQAKVVVIIALMLGMTFSALDSPSSANPHFIRLEYAFLRQAKRQVIFLWCVERGEMLSIIKLGHFSASLS